MRLLVTGCCGFIGSNFVRMMLDKHPGIAITNLDKLTYAGNPANLSDFDDDPRYEFIHGDICDEAAVEEAFARTPDAVINFAAETHVDRSIDTPATFLDTDVKGTCTLLEAVRARGIRYLQISTDEVYGSIEEGSFDEESRLAPASPYSASKAAADLLVLAYVTTYGVEALISRSSNNFGPRQYPEKLMPLFITNLLTGGKVPVYGDGLNVRDWIYVEDNCEALEAILMRGEPGGIYNVGAGNERTNMEITRLLLRAAGRGEDAIEFVKDRPGHDRRYSIESRKVRDLGWEPRHDFEAALERTFSWYADNRDWWEPIKSGEFKEYYLARYGDV
ncbi:MAG: dTDP-glucose 4,6-dehydratase [Candidatus Geothermincolia bacterium]